MSSLPGKNSPFFPGARQIALAGKCQILFTLSLLAATFCAAQTTSGTFLPDQVWNISTAPANGDLNPYGVAFIDNGFPTGSGPLQHGDILVSNFNNSKNLQGTGTTIVDINSAGAQTLFFQGPKGIGLSTALGTLHAGFVVVGTRQPRTAHPQRQARDRCSSSTIKESWCNPSRARLSSTRGI